MKNLKFLTLLPILVFMVATLTPIHAENNTTIGIVIDGERLNLDTPPMIVNDRTLVPLRGVFEKLGATVDWNKETGQAIIKNDAMEVLIAPGLQSALMNGRIKPLDSPSTIAHERLLIPIRFVAESLGHDVRWSSETKTVIITTKTTVPPKEEKALPTIGNREAFVDLLKYNSDLHRYVGARFGQIELFDTPSEAFTTDGAPETAKAETSTERSGTNNQVSGVDEGDVVKTNGNIIATISDNTVHLIDANPLAPGLLSAIPISRDRGHISNLYLTESQLVIIGSSYALYGIPEPFLRDSKILLPQTYNTTNTFVLAYDLKDPKNPKMTIDMDYEGYYVSSRLIDDALYMVTEKGIHYWSIDTLTDYELQPKYANNLTGETTLIPYDELAYFPDYVAQSVMMTVGLDLKDGTSNVQAYMGRAENVYATTDSLYLTFTHYDYAKPYNTLIYVPNYTKSTSIYAFGLDDGTITYKEKGAVPGSVLNQFSMDAYKGNLRIATTTGEMWDEKNLSKNNLYVLDEGLNILGQATDLAPGERIYSTRFHEDRIYMVTYRQVDPFFVIDAANPKAPKVLGELKIPGFSTYMHILDANHVLGFGMETNEDGTTVGSGGLKLSLFDVTNPAKPVERQKEVIGLAGTYSELQHNHKALMISLSKGVLGFPINVASSTPYVSAFDGAFVYDIAPSSFKYRGSVTHKAAGDTHYNHKRSVKRLLYIGDYLYSLSDELLMVSNLSTLEQVSTLPLTPSSK